MVNTYFVVQYVFVFILLVEFMYVVGQRVSDIKVLLLLLYVAVIIDEVGYLLQISAHTRIQIVQAEKFSYLGKPFIVLLLLMTVLEVLEFKFIQWIFYIFAGIQLSVVFMMFAFEQNKLFCINMTKSTALGYLITAIFFTIYSVRERQLKIKTGVLHGLLSIYALIFLGYLLRETEVIGYDTSMPTDVLMLQVLIVVYIKYIMPELGKDNENVQNKSIDIKEKNRDLVNITECCDFIGIFILIDINCDIENLDLAELLSNIIRSDDLIQDISDTRKAIYAMDVSDEKEAEICLNRILDGLNQSGILRQSVNMGVVFCDGKGNSNFMQLYEAAQKALKKSKEKQLNNYMIVYEI